MEETFRKLGFTDGEIRVYTALVDLNESSIGDIITDSGVSSSKVYDILDKLEQRGLVSHINRQGKKIFRVAPPTALQEIVERRKNELQELEQEISHIIPTLSDSIGSRREHDAQVYVGTKGVRTLYTRILQEAQKEYCVFAITEDEISDETSAFLANFHAKRNTNKVSVRILASKRVYEHHQQKDILHNRYEIRSTTYPLPFGAVVGTKRIAIMLFGKNIVAFEIVSETIAESLQRYFDALWEGAEPEKIE